jgi:hypothetical protein
MQDFLQNNTGKKCAHCARKQTHFKFYLRKKNPQTSQSNKRKHGKNGRKLEKFLFNMNLEQSFPLFFAEEKKSFSVEG